MNKIIRLGILKLVLSFKRTLNLKKIIKKMLWIIPAIRMVIFQLEKSIVCIQTNMILEIPPTEISNSNSYSQKVIKKTDKIYQPTKIIWYYITLKFIIIWNYLKLVFMLLIYLFIFLYKEFKINIIGRFTKRFYKWIRIFFESQHKTWLKNTGKY